MRQAQAKADAAQCGLRSTAEHSCRIGADVPVRALDRSSWIRSSGPICRAAMETKGQAGGGILIGKRSSSARCGVVWYFDIWHRIGGSSGVRRIGGAAGVAQPPGPVHEPCTDDHCWASASAHSRWVLPGSAYVVGCWVRFLGADASIRTRILGKAGQPLEQ